jgi:hypothetical protein
MLMSRTHKVLSWENVEKIVQLAVQLASLIELLRKGL